MKCVLIVEDEPAIRRLSNLMLEEAGYIVLEASNGADALEMIRKRLEAFDLIILDIRMPGMNGFEFLYRLRRQERCMSPVLVVTAHNDLCEKVLEFGADACLSKPYERDPFISAVNHLVERQPM